MKDENKKEKTTKKIRRRKSQENRHTQFYYSFLTFVLLICLIQMSFSALLNITKVISYHRKMITLKNTQIAAKARNTELKKEIKNFSTKASIEAIARNNLKMAEPDELVVIVNKKETPQTEQKNKHKKIGHKK